MARFTDFNKYNGNQALIGSGRIIFNARQDSLFLLAKKDIVLSAGGDLHVNTGPKGKTSGKLVVNTAKMQIGLPGGKTKIEPAAKGDSTVNSIDNLLSELSSFLNVLSTAKGAVAGAVADLSIINAAAKSFASKIPKLQRDLSDIKSSTLFTK